MVDFFSGCRGGLFLFLFLSLTKSSEQGFSPIIDLPGAVSRNGLLRQGTTAIPPPFSSSYRALPAIKVDPSGRVYNTQILKQQLANELGLPLRDLRVVDPSYPNQIHATFTSRKNAILFCVENIKVVVQHGEALIFSPSSPEVQEFVPALQQQIAQIAANDALLTQENGQGDSKSRFEHIVIEAALNVVCTTLFRHIRLISPAVDAALKDLRQESLGLNVLRTQVDELLPLKNKVDELRKRVKEIKRAITEVLNNDEDLAMMYLRDESVNTGGVIDDSTAGLTTSNRNIIGTISAGGVFRESVESVSVGSGGVPILRPPSEIEKVNEGHDGNIEKKGELISTEGSGGNHHVKHIGGSLSTGHGHRGESHGISTSRSGGRLDIADTMNLEMLFENYLNEVEWISSEIEDVIDEIKNTEESVALQLDMQTNRILRFELILSISSFVVTCGALITGLFGMNLLSHLELKARVFYFVTAFITCGMTGIWIAFKRYGRKHKLF